MVDVAIIGAGVSGLRTAELLLAKGYKVLVLEGSQRCGGRLLTIDTPEGRYDVGGEWIDGDHRRVHELAKSLGLTLTSNPSADGWLDFGGRLSRERNPDPELLEAEAALDRMARSKIQEDALEDQSLETVIAQLPVTDVGKRYLTAKIRSDEGEDLCHVGLLAWLSGYKLYLDRDDGAMSCYRIAEGSQALCSRMVERSGIRIEFEREVVSIEQTDSHILITSKDGLTTKARRVVLCVSPACVCQIQVLPVPPTQDAWLRARMGAANKVAMTFSRPFWKDIEFPGRLLSEREFQQLWDSSNGSNHVLQFYVCGEQARQLSQNPSVLTSWFLQAEELLPGLREHMEDFTVIDWGSSALSRGGFSCWPAGHQIAVRRRLCQSFGRLHFAGEHTAVWSGFIEGALESAERVVEELANV